MQKVLRIFVSEEPKEMEMKHTVIRLALAMAALSAAFSARAEREIFSLNDAWEFRKGGGAAELVNLPHSWNTDAYTVKDYWRGECS